MLRLPISLLLLLFLAPAIRAQVLQASCGSSTLLNGSGCGANLYTPDNTYYGGIAYGQGHFQFAASDTFMWRDNRVTIGDRQLGYSFDGTGLGISLLGASLERKTDDTTITLFVGATGQAFTTPFVLYAVRPQSFGAGVFVKHRWRGAHLYSMEVVSGLYGTQITAAQGIDYQYHDNIKLAGSAGILNNEPFIDGSIVWHPRRSVTLYGSQQSIFAPYKAIGNSAGASWHYDRFTVNAAVSDSNSKNKIVQGETIGGSVQVGIVQTQVNWYKSGNHTFTNENFIETLQWHHLTATETITQSNGQSSYSFGGGFTLSNRMSISVQHSIVFLLNGEGFQQVTGVSVSVRLPHDVTANFQTVTTPLGQTLYDVYGTTYQQVGSWSEAGTTVHATPMGKYEYAGRVLDDSGAPVEGAAIQLGKVIAYTDRDGYFSVRSKRNIPMPIAVLPEVFAAPGNWEVVSAPESITPKGDTVSRPSAIGSGSGGSTIVVRRK